jgi:hypothetical protein
VREYVSLLDDQFPFSNRGVEVKSHQFLCLTAGRFFVPTEIPPAPRGTAVNDGRRPPARSVIDSGEHGADLEVGLPLLSSASSKWSC